MDIGEYSDIRSLSRYNALEYLALGMFEQIDTLEYFRKYIHVLSYLRILHLDCATCTRLYTYSTLDYYYYLDG